MITATPLTSAAPSTDADMASKDPTSAAPSKARRRPACVTGTELAYLPPRPAPSRIDRALWPIVRVRFARIPLPVWLFAAFMCATLVLSHEVSTTPLDVLLFDIAIALIGVGSLGIAAESYARLITYNARAIERRNLLFQGYLLQRIDGHNATHHSAEYCRCEHLTVAGCELLVTVSPCKRETW